MKVDIFSFRKLVRLLISLERDCTIDLSGAALDDNHYTICTVQYWHIYAPIAGFLLTI